VGLFASKGLPQRLIDRLNAEVRRTLDLPAVKKRFADMGSETAGMSSSDFLAHVKRDAERYRSTVKNAGMKAD